MAEVTHLPGHCSVDANIALAEEPGDIIRERQQM